MSRHFCVSVTFHDRVFHGRADGEQPEWPPSPFRLFQALLAGSRTGCRLRDWSEEKIAAFRWLERREAPIIVTPRVERSNGFTLFVPNNDGDRKPDRQTRLTGKRVRPLYLCDGASIHFLWPIEEQEWPVSRPFVEILASEARKLLVLGWGIDAAFADGRVIEHDEVERIEGVRWRPSPGIAAPVDARRLPIASTLDDLDEVFRSFSESFDGKIYRPPRKPSVFGTSPYRRETSVASRPFAVFELEAEIAFRQEETAVVAAMLRSRTCADAKGDTHEFPGGSEVYVAGHLRREAGTPQRFSYLPLPSIGHPHSDGMIRRVLIAEPHEGDGSHARWAADRLRNALLTDEQGEGKTLLLEPWRSGSVLNRYIEESRVWATVTPVILPGHDDRDPRRKGPSLLLKAVEQAGIPRAAVEDFELRKAPFWPGSQHPRHYRRPDYLKHLPAWHVRIRFLDSIAGPLAIGAGRHCGLGLFAVPDSR